MTRGMLPFAIVAASALVLASASSLGCGARPQEGDIVIRAEDIAGTDPDPRSEEDSQQARDTVSADSLLTVAVPDLTETHSDTIPQDILEVIEVKAAECPWDTLALRVEGSIYASLRNRVDNPDVLGAHIVRCMWWNADPWRGMNAGDSIYVLKGETGRENSVVALRYVPVRGSSNSPFSVYSFRMTGDNYPSHYYSDGSEVMKLLSYMPITTFEEMTGPYGEPRGSSAHAGVDFKAPVGTPVRTCRGGRVTRINWNRSYNGNCIEISIGGGYSEVFLHLDAVAGGMTEGVTVEKGDIVGFVGNTGSTSTAPHLHYQINDERGNPIDPYIFFGSYRRNLPPEDMEAFKAFRDSCDRCFEGMAARSGMLDDN